MPTRKASKEIIHLVLKSLRKKTKGNNNDSALYILKFPPTTHGKIRNNVTYKYESRYKSW